MRSLLIANRGEIALRIARTARRMGLRVVAVYSPVDRAAPHVRTADLALPIESYLDMEGVVAAARAHADAVHPGYGFLAESAAFAEAVIAAGLAWVGPPPAAMRALGDKRSGKRCAIAAGLPVLPTYEGEPRFPLMIKALAGGGGRGLRLVRSAAELPAALEQARSEVAHAFGDERLLLEKALPSARHVEVQILADRHGACIHLGERDCSVQRRHQKLIEESPSPVLDSRLREEIGQSAIKLARASGYVGAGTVEFLVDETGEFYFLEVNTRLQVEHPVTELVTGLDLVEWQLRIARGEKLPCAQDEIRFAGHAIEARLCAEDPAHGHLPRSGRLLEWRAPEGVRVDHALEPGMEITPHYDSLMAKVIAYGATRAEAREKLAAALERCVALGLPTNKSFLASVLRDEEFAARGATTDFLQRRSFPVRKPDAATLAAAAALLAARSGYGEWTGWSNDPEHALRTRFDGEVMQYQYAKLRRPEDIQTYVWDGEVLHLASDGESWRLENALHAPPAKAKAAELGSGLSAPMNGRVVAVHAKAGDKVDAGRPLVVLEAMKMEHGLVLEVPVIVTAVHVSAGAQVAPGQLLVDFRAAA